MDRHLLPIRVIALAEYGEIVDDSGWTNNSGKYFLVLGISELVNNTTYSYPAAGTGAGLKLGIVEDQAGTTIDFMSYAYTYNPSSGAAQSFTQFKSKVLVPPGGKFSSFTKAHGFYLDASEVKEWL